MASSGTIGMGTTIGVGDGGAPETFTDLAQVRRANLPEYSADTVEITNFDSQFSSEDFEEHIAGVIRTGSISLEIVYKKATYNTLRALLATSQNYKITLPDAATCVFAAVMTGLTQPIEHNAELISTVTFKVTARPTDTFS